MLIYGSTAIKHWFSDFREPNDLDIIEQNPRKSSKEIQYYWIDSFEYIIKNNKNLKYVDPNFLYTIKVSHASWDINWVKTMKDIEFFQEKGCELDIELYNILYKEWTKIHGKKNVKMNVPNEGFFKSNIQRDFDHDWLHEQFSYHKRPLNEKIRENINSPLCSESLWKNLTDDDKIKCAKEEIYVLMYERYLGNSLIPLNIGLIKILKKMITSTTSGFFNLFLIMNFKSLIKITARDIIHLNKSQNKIKKINKN